MPSAVAEEAAGVRGARSAHLQRRRGVQHCAEHLAGDGESERRDGEGGIGACVVVVGPLVAVAVRSF
jgi:hypothetical protein